MKIELIGWSSEGLRCPDMNINLLVGNRPAHICLIQMPNGTAKTTTLTIIRAAMNGEAERWSSEEVNSFRRVGESHSEGSFILQVKVDEKPLTFELNFDFNEGKVYYYTTSPSLGGRTLGWKPPISLSRFFNSRFARLFIFDGELAQDLLDSTKSEASKAIDALFQLYLLEEIIEDVEKDWEKATRNKPREERGLTRQSNKVEEFKKHILYVKNISEKKTRELIQVQDLIKELNNQITTHKSLDQNLRNQLAEKKQEKLEIQAKVETTAIDLMNQIRQPHSLHSNFADSLIELKSKLDKAKLPEKASRQFFVDILEEKECICGRELSEETRQVIQKRAELYLSDHTAAFLNGLKEDIRNNLLSGNINLQSVLRNNILQLQGNIENRQLTETYCRDLERQLIEQSDDEVKLCNEKLEQLKIKQRDIETCLEKINRPQNHHDDPRHYSKTMCLQALKKWLDEEEKKLAEITGKVELRKRKNILQNIIEKSLKRASENLQASIIKDCNVKLQTILHRDPIQISEIDRSLKLKGQKAASVGQTLSVGYTFLTTLLNRGQHQFPLVVDSPANSIDAAVRREIGKLIPKLCHQFIAFTISTEREGFTDTLAQNSDNAKFLTIFRKTQGTSQLLNNLSQPGVIETKNGVIVEGKDYFDKFDLKEYPEEN